MKTIHKVIINITDFQKVQMAADAKILTVQVQRRGASEIDQIACLWFETDTDAPLMDRTIAIYGTGHPMDSIPKRYIGTIQEAGGVLVWHVYEVCYD